MASAKDLVQSADWKTEKHVPAIEAKDVVKKGEVFSVTATVGKEVAHPNTTEHHIAWISLYFLPKGEKFTYQLARMEFNSHGASIQGPNTSSVYTHANTTCSFKSDKSGTIVAVAHCNIHGLWESSKEITVE